MRIRLGIALLYLSTAQAIYAQDVAKADGLFEIFEFRKAAVAYEAMNANELTAEQLQRMILCYNQTRDYEAGIQVCSRYISKVGDDAKVYWWMSRFQKMEGRLDAALTTYDKFLALGGNGSTEKFKESCKYLKGEVDTQNGDLENLEGNSAWADFHLHTNHVDLYFSEFGLDSIGGLLDRAVTDRYEVLVMQPMIDEANSLVWNLVGEGSQSFSLNSIQIDPLSTKIYFSASQPLNENNALVSSQIYEGTLSNIGTTISDVKLWQHSAKDSMSLSHVSLSESGDLMVFTVTGPQTSGSDLYYSRFSDGKWGTPQPITYINTLGNEMFPNLHGDTLLTFSSDGRVGFGDLDIYEVRYQDWIDESSEISLLPSPINSAWDDFYLEFATSDSMIFVSNRNGGHGDDDVWSFAKYVPDPIVEEPVIEEPVIEEPVVEEPIIEEPVEEPYDIKGFLEKCNKEHIHAKFDEPTSFEDFTFLTELKRLQDEEDFKFSIEVIGHTDNRGKDAYNKQLGLKRAEGVKQDLVEFGFDQEVIHCSSKGAQEPVIDCEQKNCSEEEHAKNRFVRLNITLR